MNKFIDLANVMRKYSVDLTKLAFLTDIDFNEIRDIVFEIQEPTYEQAARLSTAVSVITGNNAPIPADFEPEKLVGTAKAKEIEQKVKNHWQVFTSVKKSKLPEILVCVDQGSASDREIVDILSDLSILYRMIGGSGIIFEHSGITLQLGHE